MARQIRVNIGSGNDLLPDGANPFPDEWVTYNLWNRFHRILGGMVSHEHVIVDVSQLVLAVVWGKSTARLISYGEPNYLSSLPEYRPFLWVPRQQPMHKPMLLPQ